MQTIEPLTVRETTIEPAIREETCGEFSGTNRIMCWMQVPLTNRGDDEKLELAGEGDNLFLVLVVALTLVVFCGRHFC